MNQLADIQFTSEDRLFLYLLRQDVGFRATHIVDQNCSLDSESVRAMDGAVLKRMHYFDKGDGVFAVLRLLNDSSDPSQRIARIVRVDFKRNDKWAKKLSRIASEFHEDSSVPLCNKDRALLLLYETIAHWSTGTREFFRKAIFLADQAVLLDPSLAQALNGKGASQASLGDTPGAIKTYLKAIQTDSRCVRPWLNLGNRHSSHGMTDRALFAYRIGVERPPLWDGDAQLQTRAAYKLRDSDGRSAETAFLLARRNEELDRLYTQHFVSGGGTISPEASKGARHGRRGEWSKALICFTRAVTDNPRDLAAGNNRAHALNQLGRHAEAVDICDAILLQKPEYYTAAQTKAEALLMLGRDEDAVRCLEKVSVNNPHNPALVYFRALIEDEMRRWFEAARPYAKLVMDSLPSCEPQREYAQRRLQEILANHDSGLFKGTRFEADLVAARRRHLSELLSCCQLSEAQRTTDDYVTGLQAYHDGDLRTALEKFKTEAVSSPAIPEPLCAKALALIAMGDSRSLKQAVAVCNRVLEKNDRHVDALVLKAEALLKGARQKGAGLRGAGLDPEHPHCTQARECYERAATIDARHPAALYWKALAEDALGDTDAASKTFRQFVVVAPDELASHLHYARTRLHHMEFWRWRNQQRALSAEVEQHV
ncbi:tetratricopeptide repeat protein [bacterium]|nr:tetratricopeptide repeat protein [bacterium]